MKIKLNKQEKAQNLDDLQNYLLLPPIILMIIGFTDDFIFGQGIVFPFIILSSLFAIVYSLVLYLKKIGRKHFRKIGIALIEIIILFLLAIIRSLPHAGV